MHLEDLLHHIAHSPYPTPPAPPIFDDPTLDGNWWNERFGFGSGEEVWVHLGGRLRDRSREESLVTRGA